MSWWLGISASESSVSVANNTSVVTVTLSVGWNSGSWAADNPGWSMTIDGTGYSGTCNFNTGRASSGTQVVATCSKTVTHNSDGSKYVSYSGGYAGTGSGWQSTSGGITCQTIPRVSELSISKSSCIAGSTSQTITVTPKASFTDTVVLSFGSQSYTIINSTGSSAKSGSYTIPLSWLSEIPNNLSGTVTVTLTTKSGSTVIGTKTGSFSLTCPDYEPTASRTLAPTSYISAFGSSRYVQLVTKVTGSITASGYNGSTISSVVTSIEGISYTGTSFTSDWLATSGSVTVTTVVTDSRGVTKTISGSVTVIAYHYPQVQASVIANASTSSASITVVGSVSPVDDLNGKNLKITWVNTSEESGTVCDEALSSYDYTSGVTKTLSDIDPTMTYQFTVRVTDSVGYKEQVIVTGKPIISRHAGGDGVAFLKEASRSGIDINDNASNCYVLNENDVSVSLIDLFHPVGDIYITVSSSFDPNTAWGGTWVRFGNGKALVGVNESDSSFKTVEKTGGEKTHKLTVSEMPSHSHRIKAWALSFSAVATSQYAPSKSQDYDNWDDSVGQHITYTGGGGSHNNLQPYITVYMWKRTE